MINYLVNNFNSLIKVEFKENGNVIVKEYTFGKDYLSWTTQILRLRFIYNEFIYHLTSSGVTKQLTKTYYTFF